ncbi:MAG TPA: hypothetical protein VMF07_07890 [Solirubrobacteraceae bacterium]|nr:hypothetical protein [Solirubrobacteraceae bacterium]
MARVGQIIHGLMDDPQQERAFLSAAGFTGGFAGCRAVTHAIKHNIPPFHNFSSKGGTHIHHSTFGIFGLLGIGYLWAQQVFTGHDAPPRWGSRITATTYGLAAALTLDEFALWLDLHDDYWDAKGRKSVDAAILFAGVLSMSVVVSEIVEDARYPKLAGFLQRLDIRRGLPKPGALQPTAQNPG